MLLFMATNKIYGIKPEENTCADLVPLGYLYQIMEQIKKIQSMMNEGEYDVGRQPLLVHIEIYLLLAKRFPNDASMSIAKMRRKSVKDTFESWWERNEKRIPKKYRDGIRQNANNLFEDLFNIKSWEKDDLTTD